MQDCEDDLWGEFGMRPSATASLVKAIVVFVIIGGAYGAAIGGVVGTTNGAAMQAGGLFVVLICIEATRIGPR